LTDIGTVRVNKILLHEVWEVEKEKFSEIIGRRIASSAHPEIYWAAGAAFVLTEFPPTDKIVNDRLEGIRHYKLVVFTRMDYEPEINTIMQGRVGVSNVESRRELADIATYLAEYYSESQASPAEVARSEV
jgi:hypothetical protein